MTQQQQKYKKRAQDPQEATERQEGKARGRKRVFPRGIIFGRITSKIDPFHDYRKEDPAESRRPKSSQSPYSQTWTKPHFK